MSESAPKLITVESVVKFKSSPTVISPPKVKFPELSPLIQATEPSVPSAIINCLSPVALSALILPIITLPAPLVILSPALEPRPILLEPVASSKASPPTAVLLSALVIDFKVSLPIPILLEPPVIAVPALAPINVLPSPEVKASKVPIPIPVLLSAELKVPVV